LEKPVPRVGRLLLAIGDRDELFSSRGTPTTTRQLRRSSSRRTERDSIHRDVDRVDVSEVTGHEPPAASCRDVRSRVITEEKPGRRAGDGLESGGEVPGGRPIQGNHPGRGVGGSRSSPGREDRAPDDHGLGASPPGVSVPGQRVSLRVPLRHGPPRGRPPVGLEGRTTYRPGFLRLISSTIDRPALWAVGPRGHSARRSPLTDHHRRLSVSFNGGAPTGGTPVTGRVADPGVPVVIPQREPWSLPASPVTRRWRSHGRRRSAGETASRFSGVWRRSHRAECGERVDLRHAGPLGGACPYFPAPKSLGCEVGREGGRETVVASPPARPVQTSGREDRRPGGDPAATSCTRSSRRARTSSLPSVATRTVRHRVGAGTSGPAGPLDEVGGGVVVLSRRPLSSSRSGVVVSARWCPSARISAAGMHRATSPEPTSEGRRRERIRKTAWCARETRSEEGDRDRVSAASADGGRPGAWNALPPRRRRSATTSPLRASSVTLVMSSVVMAPFTHPRPGPPGRPGGVTRLRPSNCRASSGFGSFPSSQERHSSPGT